MEVRKLEKETITAFDEFLNSWKLALFVEE